MQKTSRREFLKITSATIAATSCGEILSAFFADKAHAKTPLQEKGNMSKATELLLKRASEEKPTIVKMSDNVYTAVNYTVSTVSMIIGKTGIILIDAGQDVADTAKIEAEFRKITDKPLLAIVYTHGHPDHTMGTASFLKNGNNDDKKVAIWARDNFNAENKQFFALAPIFAQRGVRQAGFNLPPEKRITNGIAPVRYPKSGGFDAKSKAILPTDTFAEDKKVLNIDGIELELYKAPGETADQLFVWYPAEKMLFAGDNMYRSFPNLYAIRGAGYRDVKEWINSINLMMELKPESIVFGHTMPTLSSAESMQFMTDYRDAIKFVYDKTIEGMNKGLSIDEIGEYVQLPKNLAEKDYLIEFYGNVTWSAKSIYVGHLGWFDGNARKLMPLSVYDEAERMATMAGGKEKLLENAKIALKNNDPKWAAQLADYCIALGLPAQILKADALDMLAEDQVSGIGRNYIYTQAQEIRKSVNEKK